MTKDVHGNAAELPEKLVNPFKKLRQALLFTGRFQWFFAVFGDSFLRQKIFQQLSTDIQQKVVSLANIKDMVEFENLLQESAKNTTCLHLIDTKHLFESKDSNWPNLFNLHREAISQKAPVNLVFWMDDEHLTFLAKNAPDFWNWRSAVYDFVIENEAVDPQQRFSIDDLQLRTNERLTPKQKARVSEIQNRFINEAPESRPEADLLLELAELLLRGNELKEAIGALLKAKAIYKDLGDKNGVANAYYYLAVVHELSNQPQITKKYFDAAIACYQELGDLNTEAQVLFSYSQFDHLQNRIDHAEEKINRAIKIFRELNNYTELAKALLTFADMETLRGNYLNALNTLNESSSLFKQENMMLGVANTQVSIANTQRLTKDVDAAIANIQKAISVYSSLKENKRELANALFFLADLQSIKGKSDTALDNYQKSEELFKSLGDKLSLANTYNAMSGNELRQENVNQALEYTEKAINYYRELNENMGLSYAIGRKIRCHVVLNKISDNEFNALAEEARSAALASKLPRPLKYVENAISEYQDSKNQN